VDEVAHLVHPGAGRHHERQVLEADPVPRICIASAVEGRVEEEVCAGLAVRGAVGELVVLGEVGLEVDQRHQLVEVGLAGRQVCDVEAHVTDHQRQPFSTVTPLQ